MHDADWLIAIDVAAGRTGDRTEAIIRVASRIEREWLAPTRSTIEQKISESGSVDGAGDRLVRRTDPDGALAGDERGHDGGGAGRRMDGARSRQDHRRLLRRVKFAGLDIDIADFVFAAAANASRVQDIVITEDVLSWEIRQQLARTAPATLTVPSGRAMTIDYARRRQRQRVGEAAGVVRPGRDAADRSIEDADHLSPARAERHGRCRRRRISRVSGSVPIPKCGRSCAAAIRNTRGRRIRGGPRRRTVRSRVRRERRVAARAVRIRTGTARRNAAGAGS